jgi:endonuclease YncB( thermonuclease family)
MRILLLLALCSCSVVSSGQRVSVHDGDTLTVDGTHWRLWGVDAPELEQRCGDSGWRCGELARDALESLVSGHVVLCEPQGHSYNRTVGVCSAGGVDLGSKMVRNGWALDYRRYSHGAYEAEERAAKAATVGLWQGKFVAPWEYRIRQGIGR